MSENTGTVAIVEDDAQVLQALGRLVRALGYRTHLFGSAQQFIESASAATITCMLVDVNLAGRVSGLELVEQLQATVRTPPFIFITSAPDPGVRMRAEALGCAAFLQKPVSMQLLRAALFKAIASAIN